MRAFIILGFLAAVASAGDLSGYNYGPGVSSSIEGLSSNRVVQSVGGSSIGGGLIGTGGLLGTGYQSGGSSYNTGRLIGSSGLGGGSGLLVGSLGGGSLGGGSLGGGSLGGGLIGGGSLGGGSLGGGVIGTSGVRGTTIGLNLNALDSIPQTVEYSKQFFHFSAPEEQQDEGVITQQLSNVLKKNLQVVFIKAPENNAATNAALQLAKQAIEQRTAIYVLSKENDGAQLVGQLQQIQENVPTQPEVRFIKYRTPEDIAIAKETIQSQYDNFGGSSQVVDGGVAPVLNYASGSSLSGSGVVLGTGLGIGGGGGLSYGQVVGGGGYGTGTLLGSKGQSYGKVIGGGNYGTGSLLGTGIGKIIGGGTTYTTGSSNTNANYLPPSPLKK